MGIQSGFQAEFTTNLLLYEGKSLDMPPKSYKPQYQYSIERINKS